MIISIENENNVTVSRIVQQFKGMITKETAMEYSLERVEMEQMLRGMYRDNTALTESIL